MRVIVPIKSLHRAKSRMATVLSASERANLSVAMARDVFASLTRSPEVASVIILSQEPAILALARENYFETKYDLDDTGLNAALELCVDGLSKSSDPVLILPHDIPAITPKDIYSLSTSYSDGVTACASATDGGTNALMFRQPRPISFQFGWRSFEKHKTACLKKGVSWSEVYLDRIAHDMDTAEDLVWFLNSNIEGHTQDFLINSGVGCRLGEERKRLQHELA